MVNLFFNFKIMINIRYNFKNNEFCFYTKYKSLLVCKNFGFYYFYKKGKKIKFYSLKRLIHYLEKKEFNLI